MHRMNALWGLLACHLRTGDIGAVEACVKEAETLFAHHAELARFEPDLYAQKGHLYFRQNRIEEAIENFKGNLEACRITGNTESKTKALYNLCLNLKIIGQFEEALVWAEELAEHAQGDVETNRAAKFLGCLAEVLVYLGRVDQADLVLQPVIPWLEAGSTGDGALRARCVLAILRGEQGRYLEGYQLMQHDLKLLAGNPIELAPNQLIAAEMAWHAGLHQEARNLIAQAAPYKDTFIAFAKTWWWYVCYLVEGRPSDLEEARFVALAFAATLKNPEYRRSSLEGYYAKTVSKLWQQQDLQTVKVEITCEDGSSKIPVVWILDSGASDQQHLLESGKVGLRHHRLRRLVLEAAAGGAVPTQPDLAQALGVTLRTIESDLATLREKGVELKTLGMKGEVT